MIRWSDTFWGEGNRGFEVLTSNVKNGNSAIEEFQRILNESCQCESNYYTKLSRLQSQILKFQYAGSFTPIWHSIRDLLEKIGQTHGTTVNVYQDLLREVHNYQDIYQKKKSLINRDPDVARTAELIPLLNNTLNTVNKAKEQYHSVAFDYERAKRSGTNLNNGSSTPVPTENSIAQSAFNTLTSSTRQFERLEKKYRQSHDDYRSSVEKYNSLRNEFEKRFYDACQKFQDFENEHAEKMLNFTFQYSEILKRNNEQTRTAQNEFHDRIKQFTVSDLIEAFVDQKRTGNERPQALQFEELDNVRSSLALANVQNYSSSVTPDMTQPPPEELIDFDGDRFPVPAFQPHFPVSSPTMSSAWPSTSNINSKNELLTSTTSLGPQQIFNLTQSTSPVLNNSTSMSLSNPNNPLSRLQGLNDQPSNPFDLRIRRPAFKGFWPANRRTPKEKKNEKKSSNNSKSTKSNAQQKQNVIHEDVPGYSMNDDPNDINRMMMGSIDGLHQMPSNLTKSKCPTPEPYTQSSPSMPGKDVNRPVCQSTIPFSSSAIRKSTTSSDSSDDDDDDDDRPPSKIVFKIKPTEHKPPTTEENDEAKIIDAMRNVDKNIGPFATFSRAAAKDERGTDMSKSISSGQIINNLVPPPLPSRTNPSFPTSFTTDNFPPSSGFPVSSSDVGLTNFDDAFNPRRKPMNFTGSQHENVAPFTLHPRSNLSNRNGEKLNSLSVIDDDGEVAKTLNEQNHVSANRSARNRHTIQPMLSNFQPSIAQGRTTPFINSMSQSFVNGLTNSIDQRSSPITIGATDQIPIAVAFQETIHVMMSGDDQTKWKIRILGDMLISFPAAILNLLVDPSPHLNVLEFRLKNLNRVENVIPNPQLVTPNPSTNDNEGPTYTFDMSSLSNVLRSLQEKNRSLPFFNFGILKYEVKHSGVSSIPIIVSSQWTRTFDRINVQVNYRFNSSTFPGSIRMTDDTVIFSTVITDGQQIEQSSPNAEWSLNEHKISWKVPYTFDGSGKLNATIKANQSNTDGSDNEQQQKPLTASSTVQVRFLAENALFSSIDFDFACRGYRISLLKKKIQSGKYQSEPDATGPLQLFKRPSVEQRRLSLSTPLVV